MKKIALLLLSLLVIGCSGVTKKEKIVQENYKKFEDNLVTDSVFYIPQIPAGIDRPDKQGMYNLTIGDDTFIIKKIHIIDYKNTFAKKKIKNVSYGVLEIIYPSEVIVTFDTSNIINGGYVVMLNSANKIQMIEKIDGTAVRANSKVKKILIAPAEFVEHRLATGDSIPALK